MQRIRAEPATHSLRLSSQLSYSTRVRRQGARAPARETKSRHERLWEVISWLMPPSPQDREAHNPGIHFGSLAEKVPGTSNAFGGSLDVAPRVNGHRNT